MTTDRLSDTPRTDAVISDAWMICGVHVVSADFSRHLERKIHENNAKVKTRCDGRTCNDRAEDSQCPTCPMEYWIEI